jgi:hypothetical protein
MENLGAKNLINDIIFNFQLVQNGLRPGAFVEFADLENNGIPDKYSELQTIARNKHNLTVHNVIWRPDTNPGFIVHGSQSGCNKYCQAAIHADAENEDMGIFLGYFRPGDLRGKYALQVYKNTSTCRNE